MSGREAGFALIGGSELSTDVQMVARTPDEMVKQYAKQRALRREKELEHQLGLNGNMNVRINCAQMLARRRSGVSAAADLAERVGSFEVSSLDISSNMHTQINKRDSAYVGGFSGMRANGTGSGSIMGVWIRKWSPYRSSDVTLMCGDAPRITCRAQQAITSNIRATSGFSVSKPQGLVLLLGVERELHAFGSLKTDLELGSEGPTISSEIVWNGQTEGNLAKGAIQLNAHQLGLFGEFRHVISDAVHFYTKCALAVPSLGQLPFARHGAALCILNYPLKYAALHNCSVYICRKCLPVRPCRMLRLEMGGLRYMHSMNAAAGVGVVASLDGVALLVKYERGPQKLNVGSTASSMSQPSSAQVPVAQPMSRPGTDSAH